MTAYTEPDVRAVQAGQEEPRHTVLFVCTGNTCRSPMAAALYNQLNAPREVCSACADAVDGRNIKALSAGLYAAEGDPITPQAAEEKLLMYGELFNAPIVRNGKEATVGYHPEIWETWK